MSPRPQSSATAGTSPMVSGSEGEVKSNTERAVDEDPGRGSIPQLEHASESQLSDQNRNATPTPELPSVEADSGLFAPSMGSDYSAARVRLTRPLYCIHGALASNIFLQTKPTTATSFLRPGSRFHGTQQSERQVYEVQVEIKNVDMRESFLCGYLRIQGDSIYPGSE